MSTRASVRMPGHSAMLQVAVGGGACVELADYARAAVTSADEHPNSTYLIHQPTCQRLVVLGQKRLVGQHVLAEVLRLLRALLTRRGGGGGGRRKGAPTVLPCVRAECRAVPVCSLARAKPGCCARNPPTLACLPPLRLPACLPQQKAADVCVCECMRAAPLQGCQLANAAACCCCCCCAP